MGVPHTHQIQSAPCENQQQPSGELPIGDLERNLARWLSLKRDLRRIELARADIFEHALYGSLEDVVTRQQEFGDARNVVDLDHKLGPFCKYGMADIVAGDRKFGSRQLADGRMPPRKVDAEATGFGSIRTEVARRCVHRAECGRCDRKRERPNAPLESHGLERR